MARGETVEIQFDHYTTIRVDPVFYPNGNPVDPRRFFSKFSSMTTEALAYSEHKLGPSDPRTILPRTAVVALFVRENKLWRAAALANVNYTITIGDGPVTAEQKLSAVESVLLTLPIDTPVDDQVKRLKDLQSIIDAEAGKAPRKDAELYTGLGVQQTRLGLHDDAARAFRTVLTLSEGADVKTENLAIAHIGLSGQASKAGDCETALRHAKQAKIAFQKTALRGQFQAIVFKRTIPTIDQCGP